MNGGFECPLLPALEITAEMKSLGINVNENDLQKPDPRRWMDFYSSIYNILTSKSIEDAIQLFCHYAALKVQHGELYDEALSQMGFTICMQRVLCSCGYADFCVQDVIEPSRKRLMRIMSYVVNKIRHNMARQDTLEAISERCEQSKGEHERVLTMNKELKQQWDMKMENEEQREKQIMECTEESEKLKSQIAECERQRDPEQRIIEEFKLNISEKNALKEKLKNEKNEIQQEHEKLSQKIVPSPDRFKQDQDRLKKKVLELKDVNDVKLKKLTAEKAITEQFANSKNSSEKAVRLAKEVLSDLEKLNELVSEMDQCNEKAQELQDELSAFYTECDDVNENIAIRQSQKHTLSHQLDLKKQCAHQQKEDVKKNHEIYQGKVDRIKAQIEELKRNTSESQKKVVLLDDHYEEMRREWHKELSGIYQEIDILHNKIADGCKDFKVVFEN